jgi:hypothetical protein
MQLRNPLAGAAYLMETGLCNQHVFYCGNGQTFIDSGNPALRAQEGGTICENVTKLIRRHLQATLTVGEVGT